MNNRIFATLAKRESPVQSQRLVLKAGLFIVKTLLHRRYFAPIKIAV